jgi:putative membrane protein
MIKRNLKQYLSVTLRGIAMGAADVVPGVSGGTIAFVTGIYEELIDSIKSINLESGKVLLKEGIPAFWQKINGNFLISLFAGIAISVLSLAKAITWMLDNQPIMIWSFFFGLILSSSYFVAKKITKVDAVVSVMFIVGAAIAFYITVAAPSQTPDTLLFVFFSGFIAICAMILPGISGSFILLLLGKYYFIMDSIKGFKISVILVFILGCLLGITSFSRVISWLFHKFHNATIALLTGFMVGSLNKVWPWKEVLEFRINSHGKNVPFLEKSILPSQYAELSGDPRLVTAIIALLVGAGVIILFETWANKTDNV